MLSFFYKGGPLMYLLLFCSIVMVAFALERVYHYWKAEGDKAFPIELRRLLMQRQYDAALSAARKETGPLAAIAAVAIENRKLPVCEIESAVSLAGSLELKRLNKNLHILELIGRIAPLIGLLGTVLGMVEAFRGLADMKGAVNPSLLAGGIWEALITTVGGLAVAIPALVVHHFCEDNVSGWAFRMKMLGNEWIKLVEASGHDTV